MAVVLAYAAFSLLGFGSALLASPALALVLPVARVVPLLAMLDAAGSLARGWRSRRLIDRAALGVLLPGMLAGQLLGVALLAWLPVREMALLFGSFIVLLGLSSFRSKAAVKPVAGWWQAAVHSLAGGVLGGMFGSGGFLYARYLARRLPDRDAMRATQAVLIAVSTLWRIALCAVAGLLDVHLVVTALLLAPAALLGFRLGGRLDAGLSQARWVALLNGFLVAAGLGLIVRYLG
jgi:uncharacterized membrane protein YfcA